MNKTEQGHSMPSKDTTSILLSDTLDLLAKGECAQAEESVTACLAQQPENPAIIKSLCQILIANRNLQALSSYATAALDSIEQDKTNLEDKAFYQAAIAFSKKDYQQSLNLLSHSSDIIDENPLLVLAMAEIEVAAEHFLDAYRHFQLFCTSASAGQYYIDRKLSCLEHITATQYSEELYSGVYDYLCQSNTDPKHIRQLAHTLIQYKYDLNNEKNTIDFNSAWHDKTLIACIENISFCNKEMEIITVHLRRQALKQCLDDGYITSELIPLVNAVAEQAYTSEYIFGYDSVEEDTLAGITELLADELLLEAPDMLNIASFTLLLAMYNNIHFHPLASQLARIDLTFWPEETKSTISRIFYEALDDNKGQTDTKYQQAWADRIAKENELNGFDRWQHLSTNEPNAVKPIKPICRFNTTSFLKSIVEPKMLIVGANSGQYCLQIAARYPNCNITAIDISPKRLNYAKKMAKKFSINNIKFVELELLQCTTLQEKFHIIDLKNVLNVIENPNDGLGAAKACLESGGIIKANFFSALGREKICQFRIANQKIQLEAAMDSIRELRNSILMGQVENLNELAKWDGFYQTTKLTKLLFNTHEHNFIPDNLNSFCQTFGLNIQAFEFENNGEKITSTYQKLFPNDESMTNISNWTTFEEQMPETFKSGYRVVLQ